MRQTKEGYIVALTETRRAQVLFDGSRCAGAVLGVLSTCHQEGTAREFLKANRFPSESRVGKLNRFKAV